MATEITAARPLVSLALPENGAMRLATQIFLAIAGTLILTLSAKTKVVLGPVDMSLQTLAVFLIAVAFGRRLAVATLLLYMAQGAMGLPVFQGTPEKGIGLAYMLGSTGGYLAGFVVMAAIVGWAADRGWDRNPFKLFAAMLVGRNRHDGDGLRLARRSDRRGKGMAVRRRALHRAGPDQGRAGRGHRAGDLGACCRTSAERQLTVFSEYCDPGPRAACGPELFLEAFFPPCRHCERFAGMRFQLTAHPAKVPAGIRRHFGSVRLETSRLSARLPRRSGYRGRALLVRGRVPIAVGRKMLAKLSHLDRLEAESIHIFREVAATFAKPVMLYSVGKDSSVLMHLAMKAFYPAKPPFPFLHVDTTWKFREMIEFRDEMARKLGFDLLVHINQDGVRDGISPFVHGSNTHTHIMKTVALRQALDKYGFDAAFGGARRDEEKSRAKERIFSFRNASHVWDPKNQRPEMWNIYNTRVAPGESIRVFPLSNWTEADIWQYIRREDDPDRAAILRQASGRWSSATAC